MPLLQYTFKRWMLTGRGRTICALSLAGHLTLVCASGLQADQTIPLVIQDSLYRTNLAISNLDSLPAEVSILLYDNAGHLAAQGSVQLSSLGIISLKEVVSFVFGYPNSIPFEGFVRLRSAARIAAFASQIRNANGDPGIIAAVPDDARHFILPITTAIEPWSSTLAIVNLPARARQTGMNAISRRSRLSQRTAWKTRWIWSNPETLYSRSKPLMASGNPARAMRCSFR
jgi:hypothetical protein